MRGTAASVSARAVAATRHTTPEDRAAIRPRSVQRADDPCPMTTAGRISTLVLQEFRLCAADAMDEAARIVTTFANGIEPAVPLLRSIDDERDVAIVRALHPGETHEESMQRAALDRLVATWQPVKRYGPRITESSDNPSSSYRLAVTESGINTPDPDLPASQGDVPHEGEVARVGLIWVGAPIGTHGGLMVLLGSYDDGDQGRPDAREWPLPLSRYLRVRIYESPQ